jgi:biopolymer transport protein ExbD
MPSVKLPRKSTDTDMTPFVDIAFLILSFFIMATKMKEPDKVTPKPPDSVGSEKIPAEMSVLISMDSSRVFFQLNPPKNQEEAWRQALIEKLNATRSLNLTGTEKNSYATSKTSIGIPINQLKGYLALPADQRSKMREDGIPIRDSASNELYWWIDAARRVFADEKLKEEDIKYLIKGDQAAKYPLFEGVVDALKRNGQLKYYLVTSLEGTPEGTDLYRTSEANKAAAKKK